LQAEVVTAGGRALDVPVEKIAGKLYARCARDMWGRDAIAAPHQVARKESWFCMWAEHCDDFVREPGQWNELKKTVREEEEDGGR